MDTIPMTPEFKAAADIEAATPIATAAQLFDDMSINDLRVLVEELMDANEELAELKAYLIRATKEGQPLARLGCGYFAEMSALENLGFMLEKLTAAAAADRAPSAWIDGPPNSPGLWIVESTGGDRYAWTVTLQSNVDGPADDPKAPYLEFDDGDTSEPIEGYPWPPVRSFGPAPIPKGTA